MKLKLELRVQHQVPLRPEVAASILKKYIEEISAGGYVFDELLTGKNLQLGVMFGSGIVISRIKEIDIDEIKGCLFIDTGNEKRYYSLGTFTEISWGFC